jgi:hypothetical protein
MFVGPGDAGQYHLGDIITLGGVIFTAVGVFLAMFQLRNGAKVQRAQFLLETTDRYFSDSEVRSLFYDIDYGELHIEFEYNNHKLKYAQPTNFWRRKEFVGKFLGSKEERLLDNLLYTLDTIGRVLDMGVLTEDEAKLFAFQASRVWEDDSVKEYREWVNNERERFNKPPAHPYVEKLLEVAQRSINAQKQMKGISGS